MSSGNPKTWLVTGASSGLGLCIALAALAAGDKVLATTRDAVSSAKQHPKLEELGGRWIQLDVTSPDTEEVIAHTIKAHGGRIDIVVNNAGFMLLTSLEDAA